MIDIDALRRHLPRRLREGRAVLLAAGAKPPDSPPGLEQITVEDFLEHPPESRVPLVLLLDTLSALDRPTGQNLLGGLRDRWADEVLILHRLDDERWGLNEFLALGFRRDPDAESAAPDHAVYRTSLYDYKLTPDWLNARFWANPGMWDKARW
ncbi:MULTISPECIES: DUF6231 family protein [unclassified Thioalkalivibrio]|uniref:DUF6231 family protein n=1 Tax=unclassified Thioalkalivibrio TaxID=2621013 RepID=UPI000382744F|nr:MULTISPECIES: DUF6231 family protein [unclassified Thioalkalivibrio]